MSDKTAISWTDATWNPVTGCTPVSAGCEHCYAKCMHDRGLWSKEPFSKVTCHPDRLEIPLHWRKPRKIFVCSMGDLFYESVPDEFIDKVFAVMALCPQHTFQVLTKRAERMHLYLGNARLFCNIVSTSNKTASGEECTAFNPNLTTLARVARRFPNRLQVPLPNLWLGVTAENQTAADERIPLLLDTPAAVHFVSCEPLLGPIDFTNIQNLCFDAFYGVDNRRTKLDWAICGGETGPGARPMHPDWVRGLRDQCQVARVPFHFKQWGEWAHLDWHHEMTRTGDAWVWPDGTFHVVDGHEMPANIKGCVLVRRVGKKAAGRMLDGREWTEFPEA